MLRITRIYGWASCLACLAIAAGARGAFADEQNQNEPQSYQAERQSSDEQSQSQAQQREKKQQKQRADQQSQQRDQQWSDHSSRDQQGRFPSPARESYGREQGSRDRSGNQQWSRERDQYGRDNQWSRENQYSGQSQQRGGNDAGLGVSISREGRQQGVIVTRVYRDSPADQMGIRQGDRITRVNGREVQSTDQFISRIRNMQPGEQVELDIRRSGQQRSLRGELESRRQALVMRGGQSRGQSQWRDDARQTGYEEERFGQFQSGRSGNVDRQISRIEQQLSQLSRELDDLRYAVREIKQQSGRSSRETTARYDELGEREFDGARSERTRTTDRWQNEGPQSDGSGQQGQRSRGLQSDQRDQTNRQPGQGARQYNQGSRDYNQEESIGGETGEARLHPDRN